MDYSTARKSIAFFSPFLTREYYVSFYGGEPLLCFELIRDAVNFLKGKNAELKKRAEYSITTNGSLLTPEMMGFFNENSFSVEFSFDGLAQDISRKKGSFKKAVFNIKRLLDCPDIELEINSVFSPRTVGYLAESIEFILGLGVQNIRISLSILEPWNTGSLQKLENQLRKTRKITLEHYRKEGTIPVVNLRDGRRKGIFYCAAGSDRLSVLPDGGVWGCSLFYDFFWGRERKEESQEYEKYYFGALDNFIDNHQNIYPRVSSNYSWLSVDNYSTPRMKCFLCPEVEECMICPVNAAFAQGVLGKIPEYVCQLQKIRINERKKWGQVLHYNT